MQCKLPKVLETQTASPRTKLGNPPDPEVRRGFSPHENKRVSSTGINTQNFFPHPGTHQEILPAKSRPQNALPQHTQTQNNHYEREQPPTKGRHTEAADPFSLPKRIHTQQVAGS